MTSTKLASGGTMPERLLLSNWGRRLSGRSWQIVFLVLALALAGLLTYEAVSDQQAEAALERGLEAGIGYFDTAPHYGSGLAERRLGQALAGRRNNAVIATKLGHRMSPDLLSSGTSRRGM